MTPATIVAALTSRKGLLLLAPAILLLYATFAIGQSTQTPPAAAQKPPVAQPALSAAQRKEVEGIVKDYLLKNPELLIEMQTLLESKMDQIASAKMATAIKENAKEVFHPTASPVVGNGKGDVTVIEFFDYNCGFCKRAFVDMARLVEGDKQVKVILKEYPILAKESEQASRVALAAKLQGKYWEFHRAMLEAQGQANEASALRTAEKVGLDMTKLKKDMASPAVQKEIDDTRALAKKLGIQGTPYFLIGDKIIPGAPENLLERMTKMVAEVRKDGCKVC
jgi:protein-disulfide isomerase